jgi:hypothetical protein
MKKRPALGALFAECSLFGAPFVFFDFGWFFDPATLAATQTAQYIVCPTEMPRN